MILACTEAGEGKPVALLHGLFGAARNFGTIQRRLATRFRVIALDLRNHGNSPHAPEMTYPAMAADALETLSLRAALPAALIGHSMGGKVAMTAALADPAAVERLVVADIAPAPYAPGFTELAAAMRAMPLAPGLTRAGADAALAKAAPDPALRAFLLQNLRFGAEAAWRIGLAEIAAALPEIAGWDSAEGAVYSGPSLFIAGETSRYIRPEHRPAIRALFPAARLVTLKGAGHWLHADQPEGFARLLEAFLTPGSAPP